MFRVQSFSNSGLKSDNHLHMYFSAFIRTCNETHHGSFSPAHPPAFLVYENNFIIFLPISKVSLLCGLSWNNSIQFILTNGAQWLLYAKYGAWLWPLQAPSLTSEGQGREGHGIPLVFRFPSMMNWSEAWIWGQSGGN